MAEVKDSNGENSVSQNQEEKNEEVQKEIKNVVGIQETVDGELIVDFDSSESNFSTAECIGLLQLAVQRISSLGLENLNELGEENSGGD